MSWGIGVSSAAVVDEIGIIGATKQAMAKAITCLKPQPEFLLIDGRIRLKNRFPQNSLIRGDRKSLSIAAGSVLAKVARDRKMVALAETYPDYGFERHKGYGTQAHLAAIKKLGPCAVHRRTFAPMRETLV